MDFSTPGLPVYHQLQEFTQTHVHWVSDAIQPSHPLSPPSRPALNLSQHQGLFKWVSSSQTIQYHSNPSLCWRTWSWTVLWRPTRPFRTNTQKRCPFHYRGLECKSRKSRDTWSNRKILPWSAEWSRAKANRVLPRECTGHSKHPIPTTQEKTLHMDITRWSTPKSDWVY